MHYFIKLPSQQSVLTRFSSCNSWEEKYLYLIEIGKKLFPFPPEFRKQEYAVPGCQSQTWIYLRLNSKKNLLLLGDSDSVIVKGLVAINCVFYQGCTLRNFFKRDVHGFLRKISITQHLTAFRAYGLNAIIQCIKMQAVQLSSKRRKKTLFPNTKTC